jgi:3-deoxy-D-manno-octulosonic-acid transferase
MRDHWRQRWGLDVPAMPPGCVWIHASSVGEGRIAQGVFEELRVRAPSVALLRTAETDTGIAHAQGQHAVRAVPFDRPKALARWVRQVRPGVLGVVESALWPGMLQACRALGVPVVVIGHTGNKTRSLAARAPGLHGRCVDAVDLWLTLDGTAPGPSQTVGPLKGWPAEPVPLSLPRPILVGASTRGEELELVRAHDQGVVLAPRHPERFEAVAAALTRTGVAFDRWSQGSTGHRVLLLDALGVLPGVLRSADVAWVGGTLDAQIQGHSPREALAAGLPVVHGPHIDANRGDFEPGRCVLAQELALGIQGALALGRRAPSVPPGPGQVADVLLERRVVPPVQAPRPGLAPLVPAYAALAKRPRAAAGHDVPVISVGGLTSGGAGKTPVVRFLVERLERRGHRVAVVSRGFKRGPGPQVRAAPPTTAAWLGDELAMLAQDGVLVVSAPDRAQGIAQAVGLGAQVVVLDDAFQNPVARDVDVVVLDPADPWGGGVLPQGTAREGPDALERADVIWWHGAGDPPMDGPSVRSLGVPVPLELSGPVGAVAAIARPERFLQTLLDQGVDVRSWTTWPDHHDIPPMAGPTVTTEKDAARGFQADHVLRVRVQLTHGAELLDAVLSRAGL